MSDKNTVLNAETIAGGNTVIGIDIGGLVLPVSALRLANNSDVSTGNPLPVTAVVTSLPNVTIGAALPAGTNALGSVTIGGTLPAFATPPAVTLTSTTITGTVAATQSGSWTTVVSSLPALAAGSALIGHVVTDSGSTTVVTSIPAITFAVPQHVIIDSATLGTVTISGAVTLASTTITGTVATTQSGTWNVGLSAGSNTIGKVDQGAAGAAAWLVDASGHSLTVGSLPAITFASAQPVTLTSTTITGSVAVTNAGLSNIDVALSTVATQTTAAAILAKIITAPATAALQGGGLPAGLGAHGGLVIEGVASGVAVPTSLASLPSLAAGSAAIGSVIVTSAPTTAVTIATLPALTAGSAVIGHVIVDTAPTTAVTIASLPALTTGSATIGAVTGPSAVALSKDSTLTDGTQIAQIGAASSSTGAWTVTRYGAAVGATAIATTLLVKSGAGRVRRAHISNKSGLTIWVGITNLGTLLGNGVVPDYDMSVSNAIGTRVFDFGDGMYFSTGINLSISKTQQITDNTTTVTGITVIIEWA